MGHMHSRSTVDQVVGLLHAGISPAEASRRTGVPTSTVWYWKEQYVRRGQPRGQEHCNVPCPRCHGATLDTAAYTCLLGWYLGDGHISIERRRLPSLHLFNDMKYIGLNTELLQLLEAVKPGGRPHTRESSAGGALVITCSWMHWLCLFPQHGPGTKHTRKIQLEQWQWDLVQRHPGRLLRGLFHSDGCRVTNWATRHYKGNVTRYEYSRYFFTNHSQDIMAICQDALDLAGIEWKQPRWNMLSVNKRGAVALLDQHVGPKY